MKFLIILVATIAGAFAGTVEINLLRRIQRGETDEAIVELPQIVDQIEADQTLQSLAIKAKVPALVAAAKGLTGAAQAPYIAIAKSLGLETAQFWGSNVILVKGLNPEKLAILEATPGNFIIRAQHTAHIMSVIAGEEVNITQTVQWGIERIRAPVAWATTDGSGCIAGVIDTGINIDHVALANRYAGGWLDPYYNLGPTDTNGHGSHCAGIIQGDQNGIGVAPGAGLVGCRGMNNQGSGSEANLLTCGQFMLTVSPKPNVVSNSWGGGSGSTWFNSMATMWRNAGIVPVFALGGSGSGCGTVGSPGDQPGVIGVGATTDTDAVATFSARGPGAQGILKPEVTAPGANIVSCGTGVNNYVTMSGTSMSAPHTAGLVCLIIAQNPTYSYDQVLDALTRGPFQPPLSDADRNCGLPTPGQDFPNYAFGHGRIDCPNSLDAAAI